MSNLSELWNEYWWVLPVGLMVLCMLACMFGRGPRSGCCCGRWDRWS